ncbi:hypothetical protein [Rhizorhapis sp. SPR117]|nr:hypothetical protein [Rhizorhapis sp. SPR117]
MITNSVKFATGFQPKYISFDCYGTLIRFRMSDMAREFFADRLPPAVVGL